MTTFPTLTPTRAASAALGLAIAASLTPSAAYATTVRGGGNPVAPGSTIGAPMLGAPTFAATGSATCTSGVLAGAVGANPSASVPLAVTTFALSNCIDTFPGFDLAGISLGSPGTSTVAYTSASAPQRTVSLVGTTLRAQTRTSAVCTYTINNPSTTASAAFTNATSHLGFTAVPLATTAVPCSTANPATLTAQFGSVTVLSVPPFPPVGSAVVGSLVTVTP